MLQDFFALNAGGVIRDIAEAEEFVSHFNNASSLKHAQLERGMSVQRRKFQDIEFENVRFSHTCFYEVTFTRCKFRDCLFVGTTFEESQFHGCRFDNCNTYKFKLDNVYFDPKTFHLASSYRSSHPNIGLETFQEFYRNAQETHQPAFSATSDVQRRKWMRYQLWYEAKRERKRAGLLSAIPIGAKIFANRMFDLCARYGHGPLRFIFVSSVTFVAIGFVGKWLWPHMGLSDAEISLGESLYYSMLLMTTIGFTNAFPATTLGKLFAVGCALFGISWFGIFTAILVKRVIR
jgi:hypothetical protein